MGLGICVAIPANLQKVEAVDRLVKELSSMEKVLHVLVNNAGAAWGDSINDYPVPQHHIITAGNLSYLKIDLQDEAFTKVLNLNVQRVFTLTQKCLPLLRAGAEAGGKSGSAFIDPARIINV